MAASCYSVPCGFFPQFIECVGGSDPRDSFALFDCDVVAEGRERDRKGGVALGEAAVVASHQRLREWVRREGRFIDPRTWRVFDELLLAPVTSTAHAAE